MPHNVNGALHVLALSNLPHVQILCRQRVAVLRQSGHPDLTHTETEAATDIVQSGRKKKTNTIHQTQRTRPLPVKESTQTEPFISPLSKLKAVAVGREDTLASRGAQARGAQARWVHTRPEEKQHRQAGVDSKYHGQRQRQHNALASGAKMLPRKPALIIRIVFVLGKFQMTYGST